MGVNRIRPEELMAQWRQVGAHDATLITRENGSSANYQLAAA